MRSGVGDMEAQDIFRSEDLDNHQQNLTSTKNNESKNSFVSNEDGKFLQEDMSGIYSAIKESSEILFQ
jgi:hypothetical protein